MPNLADYSSDPRRLMALMLGREGRGGTEDFRRACGKVVLNRCASAPREGFHKDVIGNILKPWAFSSFAAPGQVAVGNQLWFPDETSAQWRELLAEADDALDDTPDPSHGAVFYFTPPCSLQRRACTQPTSQFISGSR